MTSNGVEKVTKPVSPGGEVVLLDTGERLGLDDRDVALAIDPDQLTVGPDDRRRVVQEGRCCCCWLPLCWCHPGVGVVVVVGFIITAGGPGRIGSRECPGTARASLNKETNTLMTDTVAHCHHRHRRDGVRAPPRTLRPLRPQHLYGPHRRRARWVRDPGLDRSRERVRWRLAQHHAPRRRALPDPSQQPPAR